MAVVLIALFAPRFDDGGPNNSYLLAGLFVLALYFSVLIHELAHVWVARRYGMPVASITLHLLGGETAIEGESRTPAQEFWTSVSGPLASLAIGLIALSGSFTLSAGSSHTIVASIGWVNLLVAGFNLIPGLPLDGGRVFRAIIWAATGNEATGTKAAAWIGRLFAAIAVVFPLYWLLTHNDSVGPVDIVVGILIAWFLWTGATQALRNADRSARLNSLYARRIGEAGIDAPADAPSLLADLHGIPLLRAMAATPSDVYRLTESDGTIFGRLLADRVDVAYRNGKT